MKKHMAALIAELPELEKNILILLFHEKLNAEEIALVLNISLYEVIRLYTKAIDHLRLNLRK